MVVSFLIFTALSAAAGIIFFFTANTIWLVAFLSGVVFAFLHFLLLIIFHKNRLIYYISFMALLMALFFYLKRCLTSYKYSSVIYLFMLGLVIMKIGIMFSVYLDTLKEK